MRTKALLLASILPIALALVPRAAAGQRVIYSDGCGRYSSRDCYYDSEFAREARQAALRARAEARETANWARAEARSRAAAIRSDARMWERQNWYRAQELRARLRQRSEQRLYERRGRYYRSW